MSGTHVHLMVNHFPLVALFLGLGVLAVGHFRRNVEWQKVALGLVVLGGILMAPTYFSGEEAEEIVERTVGIPKALIEEHEEAALPAAIATGVAGATALAVLFLGSRTGSLPAWGSRATLVLGFLALILIGRAANLGGRISHPEIRGETAVTGAPP